MAGNSSDESKVSGSLEGITEGVASMSPPSFNTDGDDNDSGLEPSELYGRFRWTINKFSQINSRELRSNYLEVGGHKWFILFYPKGCDVSDHFSLFLCVAKHDELLKGWNHLAQFTMCVVNKDSKKSKYSDTLHRFWKNEHDWGWKKFMKLSRLSDGFVEDDTLIVKVQVQVIRERIDRPFPCLDKLYRRELEMVYMSNIEAIFSRFLKEKRGIIGKFIEDIVRWSSFRRFWTDVDQHSRDQMSRVKPDSILSEAVKQFFVEKEVTSTLLMESLCIGLAALKEPSTPIVRMEEGSFVLVDDLVLLLEREAMESLANGAEMANQDLVGASIESNEKRLAEFGRRIIELFVLVHIFSKAEVEGHSKRLSMCFEDVRKAYT